MVRTAGWYRDSDEDVTEFWAMVPRIQVADAVRSRSK